MDCYSTLSNGLSDLINDAHTGIDIYDFFNSGTEASIKNAGKNQCETRLESAANTAVNTLPAGLIRTIASAYVNNQVSPSIDDWCDEAVDDAWAETDDNTYSGGHRCAAGRVRIDITSINLPPNVSFLAFPIDENDSRCPKDRISFPLPWPIPDLRWGND